MKKICIMCGKKHKFSNCPSVKLFIKNCRNSDFGWLSGNLKIFEKELEK